MQSELVSPQLIDRAQTSSSHPGGALRQFLFLSGIQHSYSATARAHVLRDHFKGRKVRARGRQTAKSKVALAPRTSNFLGTSKNRTKLPIENVACSGSLLDEEDVDAAPDLQTIVLGAGRIDPFGVLATQTSPFDQSLIDFYANEILGTFRKKPSQFNPPKDICFQINIVGEAAMSVMLYFALRHSKAHGAHVKTTDLFSYRARAIKSINVAISRPDLRFQDNTIMALLGYLCLLHEMASFQQFLPDVDERVELNIHTQGLMQLVQAAGGFKAVLARPQVGWVLQLVDISSYGTFSAGAFPVSLHAYHPASSLRLDWKNFQTLIPEPEDLLPIAEEFIGVYRALLFLAKSDWQGAFPDRANIYFLFQRGSLLYYHLHDTHDLAPVSSTQLALYFNLTILDYSDLPSSALTRHFVPLQKFMVEEDLDHKLSRYILMMFLITKSTDEPTCGTENNSRLNLLNRLCRVYKRLSTSLQRYYHGCLMWFLTGESGELEEPLLEPEEFRKLMMQELGLEMR